MKRCSSAIFAVGAIAFASTAPSASAVELRLRPMNGICMLTGETAEEVAVLKFIDSSIDKQKIYHSDVFMPCETMDEIRAGNKEDYYPIFIVMGTKTDGKLLPFSSMTIDKLKAQVETLLDTHDFSKDAQQQADTLNAMAQEGRLSTTFDMKTNEQAIVDVTDKTLSVAQKSVVTVNGKERDVTSIVTSLIVDGYIASIQGTAEVSTPKEFWRLQFMTEWAARQIEVVK